MILGFAQQIGPEFLKLIAGAIFLIIFIVRKIFEANKNAGVQQARPPMGPAPQPQVPKAAAPVAGQQADPLRAQVEEFLRRAGRPPQAVPPRPPQRPPQPAPASEIQVLVDPSRP